MTSALHVLAQVLASRMVDSLGWGAVIGAFTAVVLRVTRQSASTRFAVWFSTLVSLGILPLIGGLWSNGVAAATLRSAAITLPNKWAFYSFVLWLLIAGWLVLRILRGLWHVRHLRRDCVAIDPPTLDPVLQETLRHYGTGRQVTVCTSENMRVPTAIGLLNPAVVFPCWVIRELSSTEVNQILLHELAHLRRWDDWTNLAQQVVKALLFFHPAVWWIEKQVSLEREMACDDAVLAETSCPRAYAECLACLAEKSFLQRSALLAQAALGRMRQTSLRVARILDRSRSSGNNLSWKPAVSLVAGCAICCAVWSARAPKLIAFQDATQVHSMAPEAAGTAATGTDVNVSREDTRSQPYASPAVPIRQAKLNAGGLHYRAAIVKRNADSRSPLSQLRAADTVHETGGKLAVVPFTETVWVVIEGSTPASQDHHVYRIRMFRVTVLQHLIEPATGRIPRKET